MEHEVPQAPVVPGTAPPAQDRSRQSYSGTAVAGQSLCFARLLPLDSAQILPLIHGRAASVPARSRVPG